MQWPVIPAVPARQAVRRPSPAEQTAQRAAITVRPMAISVLRAASAVRPLASAAQRVARTARPLAGIAMPAAKPAQPMASTAQQAAITVLLREAMQMRPAPILSPLAAATMGRTATALPPTTKAALPSAPTAWRETAALPPPPPATTPRLVTARRRWVGTVSRLVPTQQTTAMLARLSMVRAPKSWLLMPRPSAAMRRRAVRTRSPLAVTIPAMPPMPVRRPPRPWA